MIPVVMSGGMGTRLWPLSRSQFPKQFCELLDESLLEKTLRRVSAFGSPWTITVRELEGLTRNIFRTRGIDQNQLIFEPYARNTAPAVALLCRVLEQRGLHQEVVAVFPADHLVMKEDVFRDALELARIAAEQGFVATFGIQPDHPSTGFGYIETNRKTDFEYKDLRAYDVAGFREKPDREIAERFIANGNFFWNAGIFVFRVDQMIANFAKLMPELWTSLQSLSPDLTNLDGLYKSAQSTSIDYGIMEKLDRQVCIPCDIGWSDLGSWDDVARFDAPAREMKLSNRAQIIETGSKNCFVYSSDSKVYGLVDVEDLIVVDTEDALLVSRRGRTQNVREVVQKLTKLSHSVAREHRFELRPWGKFVILKEETHYKSKLVTIDPHQALSYQSHTKRSEHWIIVKGQAEVILDGVSKTIGAGENVFVPAGTKHRIRNISNEPLEFIEVQTGTYFGEDDIVRYLDDYNR